MGEAIATVGQLAGACGHDGADWLKLAVDANGYLKVIGGGVAGAIEVAQDTPGDLLVGQHQYDGVAWRKSNLLWGYNDVVSETVSELNLPAGASAVSGSIVPAGEVWEITAVSGQVVSGTFNLLYLRINVDGVDSTLLAPTTLATGRVYAVTGKWVLKEGDWVYIWIGNATAGDDGYLTYSGAKMDIAM